MQGVLFAPLAIFLHLESIRIILLVLFGRIVAALALGAGQGDQRTHELSFKKIEIQFESVHIQQSTQLKKWSSIARAPLTS